MARFGGISLYHPGHLHICSMPFTGGVAPACTNRVLKTTTIPGEPSWRIQSPIVFKNIPLSWCQWADEFSMDSKDYINLQFNLIGSVGGGGGIGSIGNQLQIHVWWLIATKQSMFDYTVKLLHNPPLKSGHSSTTAKFSLHWRILILLLPSRSATPEFPTTDSENYQIMASNNSLKFKITKKPTEKAVHFVRFALFEVAFTKKPTVKAAKTSLLWQWPAFSLTSHDLKVIVCDFKVVKRSFLLQLPQFFWSSLDPKR